MEVKDLPDCISFPQAFDAYSTLNGSYHHLHLNIVHNGETVGFIGTLVCDFRVITGAANVTTTVIVRVRDKEDVYTASNDLLTLAMQDRNTLVDRAKLTAYHLVSLTEEAPNAATSAKRLALVDTMQAGNLH